MHGQTRMNSIKLIIEILKIYRVAFINSSFNK